MEFWLIVFLVSCSIILYNYAGYAVIANVANKLIKRRGEKRKATETLPSVSFVVAAFNEEILIEKKILDSLAQKYPTDKIEFIFITDGSTDDTPVVVKNYPLIKLLHNPERRGKSAAMNRAVSAAANEILIFSDANTTLNPEAVLFIAEHYYDKKVGGVAGEKKIIAISHSSDEMVTTEGIYWKYESFLKKIDSEFYSVVGAAGELFSVRKELYCTLPDNIILDDFVTSLKVAQDGFRVVYEPRAYAMELPSFSVKDEQKRKIRIAAGGFQAIGMLPSLLKFWKYPRLSFLYISHRVLRWTLSPLCLVLAFISNLALFFAAGYLFKALFIAQLVFYGSAFVSGIFLRGTNRFKVLKIAYYFTFMNISVVLGFIRFLRGTQSAAWEKAKRSEHGVVTQ